MPYPFKFRPHTVSLATGVIVAGSYFLLAKVNLTAQGLYYDEVHQATAAFDYLGRHPAMFNYAFHSIPVLNMSYSGAIKSNIYGLYLRIIGAQFTVYSWRILGISLVALGVVAFYWLAGPHVGISSSTIFGILLVTDISLLLLTRHDWGPTALAFSLRLVLVGIWVKSVLENRASLTLYFALGFVVGIASFEKLTAVVLLAPLALMLLAGERQNIRTWMSSLLGVLVGALPLILANAGSYLMGRGFVSFSDIGRGKPELQIPGVFSFFYQYASLGSGAVAQSRILGESPRDWWLVAEAGLILTMLLVAVFSYSRTDLTDARLSAAAVMVACYSAIAVSLLLLPRETDVHHWFLGTPFQYAAIALAAPASRPRGAWQRAFVVIVAVTIALRAPNVMAVEHSLKAGKASRSFDPAFTRLGELAAEKAHEAVFLSADWGSAAQIYCLANGPDDLVYEPFWNADPARQASDIVEHSRKKTVYVVITGMKPRFDPSIDAVVGELEQCAALEATPVDEQFRRLKQIRVLKFLRKMHAGSSAGRSECSPRAASAPQL